MVARSRSTTTASAGPGGSTERHDESEAAEPASAARPVLSAVVFAYNNEDTILPAVASLVEQDFDEPFEVIVSTSGGDPTGEMVRQAFPGVRVVESPVRLMPGGGRNLGMEVARGEIVAFLEGDASPPGWVWKRWLPTGRATTLWRVPLPWRIPRRRPLGPRRTSASRTGWKGPLRDRRVSPR